MNNKSQKTDVRANLSAAFGIRQPQAASKISRDKTYNISVFDGNGWSGGLGMPLTRITFEDAAKAIRAESEDELTNAQIDRMLARQNGVKLKSGKVLKDAWSKGSLIPTKYDE